MEKEREQETIQITDPKTGKKVEYPRDEVKVVKPVEPTEEEKRELEKVRTAEERGENTSGILRPDDGHCFEKGVIKINPKRPES